MSIEQYLSEIIEFASIIKEDYSNGNIDECFDSLDLMYMNIEKVANILECYSKE